MASPSRTLPQGKQDELAFVVRLLREEFAFATARRTMPALRGAKLLKILLFGSYARGDWVEDPVGRYFSDYDLLIVVDREAMTDFEYWERAERRLLDELSAGERLRTPVSLAVHSLEDVNEKLKLGRYFFIDAVRDGLILFEEDGHPFATPQPLTPGQALQESRDYFDDWFNSALEFLKIFEFVSAGGSPNIAAFQLHQTAERLYHCLFLVRTLYSPKTHQLNRLRRMAEDLEPSLKTVWPTTSKVERRRYALLNDAYVKARYSREYQIDVDDLTWLGSRVRVLADLVEQACRARLATLEQAA